MALRLKRGKWYSLSLKINLIGHNHDSEKNARIRIMYYSPVISFSAYSLFAFVFFREYRLFRAIHS